MELLKPLCVPVFSILLISTSAQSEEFIKYEFGLKTLKQDVKGQDITFYDTRPYLQAGIYKQNQSGTLTYGTSLNIAPNVTNSNVGNQLHWKVVEMSFKVSNDGKILFSGGALRNSKEHPAWGYSLGLGYEFTLYKRQFSIHANWSMTNTDIGGLGEETGAKDNMVWCDIGFRF